MKILFKYLFAGILISIFLLMLDSCRKRFGLDELDNLSDSLSLTGEFAGSVINTDLYLVDFVPENDSSFWIEVDDEDLLHLRLYEDSFMIYTMKDLFPLTDGGATPPLTIPANSRTDTSFLKKLKMNQKMLGGHIYFNDPIISFIIENEIPLVTFFRMDKLYVYDGDSLVLDSASYPNVNIDAPLSQGTSVHDTVKITKVEVPFLPVLFSPVPKFYSYVLTTGSDSDQDLDYPVTGDEQMIVNLDYDFPVDIRLDTLIMSDTAGLDMTSDTYRYVETAEIKIKFRNGFPIDAFSQMYFANEDSISGTVTVIDSVFTDLSHPLISDEGWNLETASTNAGGIVTSPQESIVSIELDKEKLQKLKDNGSNKLIINAKLTTYDSSSGTFVKILVSYAMGVQVAIRAKLFGSTDDF